MRTLGYCYLLLHLLLIPTIVSATETVSPYFSNDAENQLSDDSKQVIDVYYQKLPLGKIAVYEYKNSIVLPVGSLANLLGFSMKVDPKQGSADGWLLRENQRITINKSLKKLVLSGVESKLTENTVLATDSDIYVEIVALSKMFPVQLSFDYVSNRLTVTPAPPFSAADQQELISKWSQATPSNSVSSPRYTQNKPEEKATQEPAVKVTPPTPKPSRGPATTASPELVEENLLVLQASLDGVAFSQYIESYHIGDKVYLPLSGLMQLLNLAVDVDSRAGTAKGWVIKESRSFALDMNKKNATVEGKTTAYPTPPPLKNDADIYIDADIMSKWFPLDMSVNASLLTLKMKTRETLPIQLTQKRNEDWEKGNRGSRDEKHYTKVDVPYHAETAPFVDTVLGYNYSSTSSSGKHLFNYSVNSGGDLGYLSTQTFTSGDSNGISDLRITAGRADNDGKLLGPLHATQYSAGDITIPSPESLVSVNGIGRGAYVTNRPLTAPTQFDTTEFIGNSSPGWQVELYRNGALLGLQQIGTDGKYSFTSIPILYGDNSFRLVFYGPQGQIKEELHHINTDSSLLHKGALTYLVSADQTSKTLFGLGAENNATPQQPSGLQSLTEIEYGLTNRITATAGAITLPTEAGQQTYDTVGLITSLPGGILARSEMVYDINGGGSAEGIKLLTSFHNVSLTGKYSAYHNFNDGSSATATPESRLKSSTSFDLNTPIPHLMGFSLGENIKRDILVTDLIRTTEATRLSGTIFGINLTNNVNVNEQDTSSGKTTTITGDLSSNKSIGTLAIRSDIGYTLPDKKITTYNISLQKKMTETVVSNVTYTKDLSTDNKSTLSGSLNWDMKVAKLSLTLSVDSTRAIIAGTNLVFSFGRDPREGTWHAQGDGMAGSGAVSARPFLDKNYNGVYDDGDEWIKDGAIRVSNREIKSDSNGIAFAVAQSNPTQVTLDETSIKDPLWTIEEPNFSFAPRPGVVTQINFPIIATSEVEGNTLQENDKQPASNIEIELVNEKGEVTNKAYSEFDGFFLISKIKPGKYTLRVSSKSLQKRHFKANTIPITITGESTVFQDQKILLHSTDTVTPPIAPPAAPEKTPTIIISEQPPATAVPVAKVETREAPPTTASIPAAKTETVVAAAPPDTPPPPSIETLSGQLGEFDDWDTAELFTKKLQSHYMGRGEFAMEKSESTASKDKVIVTLKGASDQELEEVIAIARMML